MNGGALRQMIESRDRKRAYCACLTDREVAWLIEALVLPGHDAFGPESALLRSAAERLARAAGGPVTAADRTEAPAPALEREIPAEFFG